MSSTMTVRQMRIRAKSHGLKGYSNMRKAELHDLLDAVRHNVGDIVERAIDRKRGVVVEIQNSTFDGVHDSTVIVQYDGEKREDATCGVHHAFVFISRPEAPRKMDRYSHWATSFPLSKYGDGNVCQGHADYCAEYGHATEKSTDLNGVTTVAGHCPRCGDTLKTPEQTMTTAFLLRSGDTVSTGTDRAAQPQFAGGWATKIYMDDAYYMITIRYDSYSARERALSSLLRAWPGVSFERGEGNTTLVVFLPHSF